MTIAALSPLDLAALLCSRVCHDVIGPVGAIINGLEVLDDEKDEEMRAIALDLIKKSATSASAKLQFCRLAFGASGALGGDLDTGDAEAVTRGLVANDRTTLVWNAPRQFAPKTKIKLLLNLCLVAAAAVPRGGVITVALSGQGEAMDIDIEAKGVNARLSHGVADILSGARGADTIDAHSIQPYYATLLARECGLALDVTTAQDLVKVRAAPAAAKAAGDTAATQAPAA